MEERTNHDLLITKANKSFKWAALAEIASKIIVPLMNMILARLISPAVFGVVATLTIVTSFAQTLSEAGFARYVQQHQYIDEEEKKKTNKTLMTSSLIFGLSIFILICSFVFPITSFIGASGYEKELIITSISIPFHSIIAIEIAILKRDFKFKKTAWIRIGTTILTAIIEILVALFGFGLAALTWGPTLSSIILAIILFFSLDEKRIFGFSFSIFKNSFKVNALFIIESLLVWLSTAIDVLLIGNAFGEEIVGVYKLAFTTEQGIFAVVSAIFTPVLISLLSKINFSDQENNIKILSSYQKAVAFISVPLGIGMFSFSKGLSEILLGHQWGSAYIVFACFGFMEIIKIPISNFISTLMISKGKPQGSIICMIPYLIVSALCCLFARYLGFIPFVILRASSLIVLSLTYSFACFKIIKVKSFTFWKNLFPSLTGSILMFLFSLLISSANASIKSTLISIIMCATIYFVFMYIFFKKEFYNFISIVLGLKKDE